MNTIKRLGYMDILHRHIARIIHTYCRIPGQVSISAKKLLKIFHTFILYRV